MAVWKLGLGMLAVLSSCAQGPRARPITGPDGSKMVHVSCRGDQGACFDLAGQSCPNGYQLAPVFGERDDNFLVRCRLPALVAAPPAAVAAAATPVATPEWPPPEQSWSTPDPWSTASGTPTPSTALPPTHYLPNGQIDVGY